MEVRPLNKSDRRDKTVSPAISARALSEESITAGFKHAALLVIIAVTAAKLAPMFITFG